MSTLSSTYVIAGGHRGRARLRELSAALHDTTLAFLERAGVPRATRILDLGCGGGDVTSAMAEMAPHAIVLGIDADPVVVELATAEARDRKVSNVRYEVGDVTELDLGDGRYDVVYARFLLSHLRRPDELLDRLVRALRPGGIVAVEDVDIPGAVCVPDLLAFRRVNALVSAAMRRRGGDPELGKQLAALLHRAGLHDVHALAVQPGGLCGEAKRVQLRTLEATADALADLGLAGRDEIDDLRTTLAEFVDRPDTYATTARVFQCLGRRAAGPADPG